MIPAALRQRAADPKRSGLRRQIILSMTVLASSAVLLVVCGTYVFYAVALTYFPASISDDLLPSSVEVGWLAATMLTALVLAGVTAVKLARRILTPLNSVAVNLRRVAEGDLSARAAADGLSMGEATHLVEDFNRMAERLDRMAKERAFWNAAIAHELRTPVTVLRGRLQGLTEGVFQPTPALFSGLLAQVEGLSRLVEDLRVLALDESGRLELQREQGGIAAAIAGTVSAFEPALHAAGLRPVLGVMDAETVCDPVRIRQALLALLDNAVHHADPGTLTIRFLTNGGVACLEVEDTGPGMPGGLGQGVFDAFCRGPEARPGSGSGLGLAVVKAVARAHGGEAVCRAGTAGGTVIALTWPD
ncbi:two-component system sensor histidine kinase AdeS [Azospirillum fermentarium]|uniref:ATP-binding protein n=1 Tax=Azospirillum fermentarium TaxID=1233114 RepID=UPI002227E40A|nr:ATP-binding protein [Azospirillum fermentarium]MCW2248597.1 two-component system sensor histidine kinase AdeS [Azospirillum fermentarium]